MEKELELMEIIDAIIATAEEEMKETKEEEQSAADYYDVLSLEDSYLL